ncbi:hypothetical protein EVAR_68417_1 [Eumeta japonica]|uniref:Uncharacterized protein n=1 Tax=Eumeta variegata TaxID=151549 RepID=A0A4C1ZWM4_EUMVA|nr:hypothetical protein EVAR_68417_1 [Eumeta japonica]
MAPHKERKSIGIAETIRALESRSHSRRLRRLTQSRRAHAHAQCGRPRSASARLRRAAMCCFRRASNCKKFHLIRQQYELPPTSPFGVILSLHEARPTSCFICRNPVNLADRSVQSHKTYCKA